MDVQARTQQVREASLGWMLKRLAGGLDAEMNARLAPLDLDLSRFAVLMTVLEHSPLSQAAIAERLRTAPYKISRAVDRLEKAGFVARHPDPASRRALVIRPTDAAAALAPRLYAVVDETNAALAAPLTPEERALFEGLLARLIRSREGGNAV